MNIKIEGDKKEAWRLEQIFKRDKPKRGFVKGHPPLSRGKSTKE